MDSVRVCISLYVLYLDYDSRMISMYVCVFFPFILDIKFVGRNSRGHKGFFIHVPSAVRALIFLARRIPPFLSLVDRRVNRSGNQIKCRREPTVTLYTNIHILIAMQGWTPNKKQKQNRNNVVHHQRSTQNSKRTS